MTSPFYKLDNISKQLSVNIFIKRDDLLPLYFGGNKVRKNEYIISSYFNKNNKIDAIITNGGSDSNHARVCALMGEKLNAEVHLVMHGSELKSPFANGNAFILNCTSAKKYYVSEDEIKNKILEIKDKLLFSGKKVLVIPGGAHTIEGAIAYSNAVGELTLEADYIVHASGTGATQAGILSGVKSRNLKTKVIGVSVARTKERGIKPIFDLYSELYGFARKDDVIFLDDYTVGGYGKYDEKLLDFIMKFISCESIPLDPFYSGKAMYGLIDLINKGIIKKGSDVIFWHTGGNLNLQSSRVF